MSCVVNPSPGPLSVQGREPGWVAGCCGPLRAAGGFFAGALGRSASSVEQMADMARGAGRDAALKKAVEEMRPYFHQCHRCGNWICRDACWNEQAGLCADCSPKIEQELGALQADERVRQIQEKLTTVDLTANIDVGRTIVACCPQCMAETHGAKFCPDCGTSLAPKATCHGCGTEARVGTRFGPECGLSMTR